MRVIYVLASVVTLPAAVWLTVEAGVTAVPGVAVVSDSVGRELRGGGCGNKWKDSPVKCKLGTLFCGTKVTKCSDSSVTSLSPDGDGDEKVQNSGSFSCRVCNSVLEDCGNKVNYVSKTIGCTSDK